VIGYDLHHEKGERFRVVHTTDRTQIAIMTLPPGQSMGSEEGHTASDQVVFVLEGRFEVTIDDDTRELRAGEVAVIPQGTSHKLRATGRRSATAFSVYGPPAYPAEDRTAAPLHDDAAVITET
jgi:mannose-6-phosphate isomerase-like protein (cupin superfamily)